MMLENPAEGSQPNVLDANHMVDVIFGRGKKQFPVM